jgi:hypothetical protein
MKLRARDRFFPLLQPKFVTSNTMSINPDLLCDDISSAMSTGTLLAHDLVPDGLPASSRGPDTPYWRDKIAGTISVIERFDPIAWWSQPDIEEAFCRPRQEQPQTLLRVWHTSGCTAKCPGPCWKIDRVPVSV